MCVTIIQTDFFIPVQKTYEALCFQSDMNNLRTPSIEGSVGGWSRASQDRLNGVYGLVGIRNTMAMRHLQGGVQHG